MADNDWQRTVTRAVVGSGQVAGRVRWIWETEDGRTRLRRIVGRTLTVAFGLWSAFALGTHWPWVGAAEIIALLWYGHAKAELEAAPRLAEDDDEVELTAEEQVLGLVVGIIGDSPGIHLDTLLDHLRREPGCEEMMREELRAILADVGCPIRRALRVGTRTGIAGVHRDDAQAALDTLYDSLYQAAPPLPQPVTPSDL
jgi:hypothetical protein